MWSASRCDLPGRLPRQVMPPPAGDNALHSVDKLVDNLWMNSAGYSTSLQKLLFG